MGRIDYDAPWPGESRDEAFYNNFLTNIVTESGALDADNFAAEGLDFERFQAHPAGDEAFFIEETTRENAGIGSTSWVTLAWPTAAPTTFNQNTINIAQGSLLLVRARIHIVSSISNNVGLVAGEWVEARISYTPSGGSLTAFAPSVRRLGALTGFDTHGVLCPFAWFQGPLTLSNVRVEYRKSTALANLFPEVGSLWGELHHKVA